MSRTQLLAAWLYLTAAVVWVVDRSTKTWAEGSLRGREPIRVVPHVLQLTYTTNSGGAFGLGRSAPLLFAGATIVVSAVIVWYSLRLTQPLVAISLGLVLGGALGNLTDRVTNGGGLSGHVVDFIDVHVWPVFNVADAAVVIGAVLLALASLHHKEE